MEREIKIINEQKRKETAKFSDECTALQMKLEEEAESKNWQMACTHGEVAALQKDLEGKTDNGKTCHLHKDVMIMDLVILGLPGQK